MISCSTLSSWQKQKKSSNQKKTNASKLYSSFHCRHKPCFLFFRFVYNSSYAKTCKEIKSSNFILSPLSSIAIAVAIDISLSFFLIQCKFQTDSMQMNVSFRNFPFILWWQRLKKPYEKIKRVFYVPIAQHLHLFPVPKYRKYLICLIMIL